MSIKRLVTNASWSLLAHVMGRGSLVFSSIILARSFDSTEFAVYSYFQLTVSTLASYAAMGMGVSASRLFAETDHKEVQPETPLGTLWVLSVIAGLVFAVVTMSVPVTWVDGGLGVSQWLLALGVFAIAIGAVPAGGALGLERYKETTVTASVSGLVLILGAIIAGKYGSATDAIWVFIIASLIQVVGNVTVVLRQINLHCFIKSARLGRFEIQRIARLTGPMVGVSLLAASGTWVVGRIILHSKAGVHGFSLYVIGLQWYSLVLILPGMVSRVVLPRLIKVRLNDTNANREEGRQLVINGVLVTVIAAFLMCILGVFFSPWLLKLYGSNYTDKWLIAVFLLAALPLAPANTLGNAIVSHDGQFTWLAVTAIWFVALILIAYELANYGAMGGAIAQGLAALILTFMAIFLAKKRSLI